MRTRLLFQELVICSSMIPNIGQRTFWGLAGIMHAFLYILTVICQTALVPDTLLIGHSRNNCWIFLILIIEYMYSKNRCPYDNKRIITW